MKLPARRRMYVAFRCPRSPSVPPAETVNSFVSGDFRSGSSMTFCVANEPSTMK